MLSVIIPAYNEERTLPTVLDRVLALNSRPQVIVVSDGSNDRTAEIIREYQRSHGIIGVICPVNSGKGAAIQAGLHYATQAYTIIQDADLEYSPEEYARLVKEIRSRPKTVVYGSRNLRHPQVRRTQLQYIRFWLGGKIVTLIGNLLFGTHLTDEATCYKLFPTELLKRMNLTQRGFDFCPEVTGKALRLGYRIHEIPIEYRPRSVEEGKKIRAKDGLIAVGVLVWCRVMPVKWVRERVDHARGSRTYS
jgi:glycosyltransferase involved in cell wall biosynthesis